MKKIAFALVALALLVGTAVAGTLSFQTFSATAYVPVTVAAGSPVAVGTLGRKTVTLESMGTETIQVQISLDTSSTPASASWTDEGAALTASGSLEITKPCAWLRLNVTAWTSGTPTLRVAGINRL